MHRTSLNSLQLHLWPSSSTPQKTLLIVSMSHSRNQPIRSIHVCMQTTFRGTICHLPCRSDGVGSTVQRPVRKAPSTQHILVSCTTVRVEEQHAGENNAHIPAVIHTASFWYKRDAQQAPLRPVTNASARCYLFNPPQW